MKTKEIKKQAELYQEIVELDSKILSLDKVAKSVSGDRVYSIELQSRDNKPEKKSSCSFNGFMTIQLDWEDNTTIIPTTTNLSHKENVNEKHFFIYLNYLLELYKKRRDFLIKKLQK